MRTAIKSVFFGIVTALAAFAKAEPSFRNAAPSACGFDCRFFGFFVVLFVGRRS